MSCMVCVNQKQKENMQQNRVLPIKHHCIQRNSLYENGLEETTNKGANRMGSLAKRLCDAVPQSSVLINPMQQNKNKAAKTRPLLLLQIRSHRSFQFHSAIAFSINIKDVSPMAKWDNGMEIARAIMPSKYRI